MLTLAPEWEPRPGWTAHESLLVVVCLLGGKGMGVMGGRCAGGLCGFVRVAIES